MKYRKKPIVIEAFQTDKEVIIKTLEGDMKANVGDYIITGVNGEQYPCKPDIFQKTYEQTGAQPDPTTAEMWEWLGRNFSVTFLHRDGENDYLEIAHGFWNHISEENGFDACVRAAYAEAKKQEVTE